MNDKADHQIFKTLVLYDTELKLKHLFNKYTKMFDNTVGYNDQSKEG